jgi:hypothetical protein
MIAGQDQLKNTSRLANHLKTNLRSKTCAHLWVEVIETHPHGFCCTAILEFEKKPWSVKQEVFFFLDKTIILHPMCSLSERNSKFYTAATCLNMALSAKEMCKLL